MNPFPLLQSNMYTACLLSLIEIQVNMLIKSSGIITIPIVAFDVCALLEIFVEEGNKNTTDYE